MQANLLKISCMLLLILTACKLGPDYKKPDMSIADQFKEKTIDWKVAKPSAGNGQWWQMFGNQDLEILAKNLEQKNYNIQAAESSYKQALALVDIARNGYLPAIVPNYSVTRQRQAASGSSGYQTSNSRSLLLSATWEADIWGNITRTIESSQASADVVKAQLAAAKLSTKTSLAQYYYELKMVEKDQELLDQIVVANQALLSYNKNRYQVGVAGDQAVVQAEQQVQTAKTQAGNNAITCAQYYHGLAVLTGELPANFSFKIDPKTTYPALVIPNTLPSDLLQNRPDIAAAERQVAIANANIGIEQSAYFPSLNLVGSMTLKGNGIQNLLSLPMAIWSVGPQLALNLTNLASYKSATQAAQENYNVSVANYRNTVLSAFQDVEDNIAAFNVLTEQVKIQQIAADSAKRNLEIVENQYQAGIVDQAQWLAAQISNYNAQKTLNDTKGLQTTTSIALIKALGGGWDY